MTNAPQMFAILLQFHTVRGKRDSLVFYLEGSLIDPDRLWWLLGTHIPQF